MSIGLTSGPFHPPPYPVRKFTVDEYHQLIRIGMLTEDDPVELLEGWIVPKMPRNTPPDVTIDKAQDALRAALPPGWRLRVQSAITTRDSEPEPDFAIVPGPPERYLAHHPLPQDIAVVIEVADTSLDRDRRDKGRLYAGSSLPVYWIVNLVDSQVEVYTDPSGPDPAATYRQQQVYGRNDSVPLVVVAGTSARRIVVAELLP